jgi:hypothetical protein
MFAVIIAVLAVAALLKLVSWWGYKPVCWFASFSRRCILHEVRLFCRSSLLCGGWIQTLYDSFDAALKKRAPKIKYPKYANVRGRLL